MQMSHEQSTLDLLLVLLLMFNYMSMVKGKVHIKMSNKADVLHYNRTTSSII